jgi:hypothetical protein
MRDVPVSQRRRMTPTRYAVPTTVRGLVSPRGARRNTERASVIGPGDHRALSGCPQMARTRARNPKMSVNIARLPTSTRTRLPTNAVTIWGFEPVFGGGKVRRSIHGSNVVWTSGRGALRASVHQLLRPSGVTRVESLEKGRVRVITRRRAASARHVRGSVFGGRVMV